MPRWTCAWISGRPCTAKEVVNDYSEMELYRIIRDYGEERFAKNIAKHIVSARKEKQLETTGELIHVIKAAIPDEGESDRRTPGQKDLPGNTDRGKQGIVCAGSFAGRYD